MCNQNFVFFGMPPVACNAYFTEHAMHREGCSRTKFRSTPVFEFSSEISLTVFRGNMKWCFSGAVNAVNDKLAFSGGEQRTYRVVTTVPEKRKHEHKSVTSDTYNMTV